MKHRTFYSTKKEIEFIDGLGTFGPTPKDPIPLLKGYLEASVGRKKWGRIDPRIAVAHATARLRHLERIAVIS